MHESRLHKTKLRTHTDCFITIRILESSQFQVVQKEVKVVEKIATVLFVRISAEEGREQMMIFFTLQQQQHEIPSIHKKKFGVIDDLNNNRNDNENTGALD